MTKSDDNNLLTTQEQLVWSQAFVAAYNQDEEGRRVGRLEDRMFLYALKAATVVVDMRMASRTAPRIQTASSMGPLATLFLSQMAAPPAPENKLLTRNEANQLFAAIDRAYPGPYPHTDLSDKAVELRALVRKVTEVINLKG